MEKKKKKIEKIKFFSTLFLVSRPTFPLAARPFTRRSRAFNFPFASRQLTRVEDALFQKKVQTLVKKRHYTRLIPRRLKLLPRLVCFAKGQGRRRGASKASPRKLRGGRCCRLFRLWPATSNRFNRRSNRES